MRRRGGGAQATSAGWENKWFSTISCICVDGTSLSPGLIYQAVSGKIQDKWLQDINPNDHHCFFTSSASGWTNDDLGYAWLTTLLVAKQKQRHEGVGSF
jgi:hypothetical protein